MVRIDAAFKTAWTAMNRSIPRTRPEEFVSLHGRFVEACGPAEDDHLTAARYRALQGFVELFEKAERKPVAVCECLKAVRRTISAAADLGRVLDPAPELSLTEDEEAALACLV